MNATFTPQPGHQPGPLAFTCDGGQTQFTVPRNLRVRGFRLIVEAGDSLLAWESLAESASGAVPTGPGFDSETSGTFPTMTVQDPEDDDARRFYRLRAVAE